MYCPSCGHEISVELKYCNRCGANLMIVAQSYPAPEVKPAKLGFPAVVLGLTVTIGIGIIVSAATELARLQLHPAAIAWIVIFSMATLFGCTALILRFWLKVFTLNREAYQAPQQLRPPMQATPVLPPQQFTSPRLDAMPSVTEHTTRTFSPIYRNEPESGTR